MPEVEESWPKRLWHALRKLFSRRARESTPLEYDLRQEVELLRADLARRDARISDLEFEAASLSSSLKISNLEVAKLAEVLERDRRRVEAETATLARKIADAKNPD